MVCFFGKDTGKMPAPALEICVVLREALNGNEGVAMSAFLAGDGGWP
jgi:hypothetical protein